MAQQQRDATARQDYEELRSRDRANLHLVTETMRAWLSLFGLQRRS